MLNVYSKLYEKHPSLAIEEIVNLTSELTGVSQRSVYSARSELLNKRSFVGLLVRSGIAKCIIFMKEMNLQQLLKVLQFVNEDPELPTIKITSFYSLLHEIAFEFLDRNRKKLILLLWRRT